MKSKLTLLSLFLAATLITSQLSAAEEKTTTVDTATTADKSEDKAASTDTTAPDSDEELVGGMSWQNFLLEVAGQLASELTKGKFEDIQAKACRKGAVGSAGCTSSPFSLRSCGGVACRSGVDLINTAIIALCGDYTDKDGSFMSSTCVSKMPKKTEKDYYKARKALCEMSSSQYPFVEDIKKILRKAELCPSK